jgi:hypothetical protein
MAAGRIFVHVHAAIEQETHDSSAATARSDSNGKDAKADRFTVSSFPLRHDCKQLLFRMLRWPVDAPRAINAAT